MSLLDISHYNAGGTGPDWPQVARDPGIDGFYIKTTEGVADIDSWWRSYASHIDQVGKPRGAYHFADLGDPVAEANHFADQYLSGGEWTLRPVLDIETNSATPTWISRFRAQFRGRVGRPQFRVYSSYALLVGGLSPVNWIDSDTDIWAARYNSVLGWNHPKLVLWQNTSTANVPGFLGSVDEDQYMNGWTPGLDAGLLGGVMGNTIMPLTVNNAKGHAYATFTQGDNSAYFAEGWGSFRMLYGPAGQVSVRVSLLADDGSLKEDKIVSVGPRQRWREKFPNDVSGFVLDWDPKLGEIDGCVELKGK